MKVKQQNHITAFLFLGLLGFFLLACARGEAAALPLPKATLTAAAGEFYLPERPTAPVPPSRPGEQKEKQKAADAPKKPPAKEPVPPRPAPEAAEKKPLRKSGEAPQKNPTAEQAPPQPQAAQQGAAALEPAEDNPTDHPQKMKPAEKEIPFLQAFIKNSLYAIAFLSVVALILYLYFTTPKDPAAPKKPAAPTAAASIARPAPPDEKPTAAAGLNKAKIMNTSLLKQLIRYDMETYGEIRSNLDYEQPAYVERLIRKYGGGDKNKINRAIHLFYANREKK